MRLAERRPINEELRMQLRIHGLQEWHPKFAWRPVLVQWQGKAERRWLETVMRRFPKAEIVWGTLGNEHYRKIKRGEPEYQVACWYY